MADIEFIYFDLGNVILKFDHEIGCRQIAQISGVAPETVRAAMFDSGLEDRFESGLIDGDEFHEEFCRLSGSKPAKQELMLAASDIFTPNLTIFPLIAQLRAAAFPIGVLSNTCFAHWDFVQSRYLVLREFFLSYVLSYEQRSMKPDGKIYQQAIETAGCPASKCFFVDDRVENVAGAKQAGIDAVLYRSVNELAKELVARGVTINF